MENGIFAWLDTAQTLSRIKKIASRKSPALIKQQHLQEIFGFWGEGKKKKTHIFHKSFFSF